MDVNPHSLIRILLDDYGYDFSDYSPSHITRRISGWMSRNGLTSIADACQWVRTDQAAALSLIRQFSINVTEMFRDPDFYEAIREEVIPALKTYPLVRIWHAGCATGEEVYSMAILLQEEGLYNRCRIYATDFNEAALQKARNGIYADSQIKKFAANYRKAGGKFPFSGYYRSRYGSVIMDQSLKKNVVWANHNLVTDWVFSEVNLVVCRNVLIYFNKDLQKRVLELFLHSLSKDGFLCLGMKEAIAPGPVKDNFRVIDEKMKIYQVAKNSY